MATVERISYELAHFSGGVGGFRTFYICVSTRGESVPGLFQNDRIRIILQASRFGFFLAQKVGQVI